MTPAAVRTDRPRQQEAGMNPKETLKKYLVSREDARYDKELGEKIDSYANWYRLHHRQLEKEMNQTDHSGGEKLTAEVVRYSHLRNYIVSISGQPQMPDILVCCDDDGVLSSYALTLIRDYFAAHPDIGLIYGDEDIVDEKGAPQDAWFKADWSPDTFLSTFYFGNIFALRTALLYLINPGGRIASDYESSMKMREDSLEEDEARRRDLDDSMRAWIYGKLCLKLAQAEGGFSRRNVQGGALRAEDAGEQEGAESAADGAGGPGDAAPEFPIGHIPEILFHANKKSKPWDSNLIRGSLTGRYSSESAKERLISIIIPSKDNPKVLGTCIHSIEKYTDNTPYEIIVVDNGSSPENRAKVEALLAAHNETGSARYIYAPMEFNFSAMCNMGAQEAAGELLLFLNDDIEVSRPSWLMYLSEKAKLPYVGCVGMKLLYPHSDMIQHAGVVNVRVGPIHKLQYCSNREEHYYGFNKGVRNVIAVTGACLMIRTELFRRVGGFDADSFAVAFNDVDLCLKVFEEGYYNVVRNNMYLYHHESLSRGDDRQDKVKAQRLSGEQQRLLSRHPALFRADPFYHRYLEQDPTVTEFKIATEDVLLRDPAYVELRPVKGMLHGAKEDAVLRLGVEYAGSLDNWLRGPVGEKIKKKEEGGYYIKGYAFVIDADNAVYERLLLLQREGDTEIRTAATERVYRPDIEARLTRQTNVSLTGFMTAIRPDALTPGRYRIGMLANDRTSRQKLFIWSDTYLTAE